MDIIGHFRTITRHKIKVMQHCFRIGLYRQGLTHDNSKYSPVEFFSGAKFYNGTRSPNETERETNGYSLAWMHHKGRNRHHFEYWVDINPVSKRYEPVKMPLKYAAEMFCDRVAASKIYNGSRYTDRTALDYFNRGRPVRIIHSETSDFLEKLLTMLADEGEEKTFSYLKKYLKENEDY